MTTERILIVDDEETLCEVLKLNLENEGYDVDIAFSAEEALALDLKKYSLILLDIMMGGISGIKMAKMLKADVTTADIPIIFCTARDTEDDMIMGLNIGADDYIMKPYTVRNVIARVKSVLRRTSSHKINNVLGQALLAKKMGKTRIIAETGAGQHGVATATAAALLGLKCEIFMGKEDIERQALNVYKMELLGAKVHSVTTGTMTLKDAVNACMNEWATHTEDTFYVLGSVMGPHPYPMIVRDFQSVISKEAKQQILEKEGKLPDVVIACVGGGSNAMGMFYEFIQDESVQLIGCEAAGKGIHTNETAATISTGTIGIFHGMKSYFCQDEQGQIAPVYSISAGLDYPGIGPEHAHLHDTKRAQYVPITDEEAVHAFEYVAKTEGIIAAIESSHAVAHVMKIAPTMRKDQIIICCLSGRGDKDVAAIARYRGVELYE